MFKTRLLSGIVLVILAFLTMYSGGIILFLTLACISLIGMQELYKATGVHKSGFSYIEVAGYIGAILYYAVIYTGQQQFETVVLVGALILLMFVYVFSYPKFEHRQIMAAYFGIIYVAVMLSFIYLTRCTPGGIFHVWLIFICSWGCDTCAYCVGMLIGKHKMAPVLSPKKSVEGAVGGVVGAAALGMIYAAVIHEEVLVYGIICAVGACISMVGDLAASAIKRQTEIKDYGKLIPGHGGILDRFDSVIFTAPVIYFLIQLMMGV